jgi:hypothetical protein
VKDHHYCRVSHIIFLPRDLSPTSAPLADHGAVIRESLRRKGEGIHRGVERNDQVHGRRLWTTLCCGKTPPLTVTQRRMFPCAQTFLTDVHRSHNNPLTRLDWRKQVYVLPPAVSRALLPMLTRPSGRLYKRQRLSFHVTRPPKQSASLQGLS